MKAPGFCTCKRDFPHRDDFHPPTNASWHFLCDKPVLSYALTEYAAGCNGESVRIGEDYDQAATDYARIETGEL